MDCTGRLLLATFTAMVAATACPLRRPGDPGFTLFEVSVLLEDKGSNDVANCTWRTPAGPYQVVCELSRDTDRDLISVYEDVPGAAFVGGAARLDFATGDGNDLFTAADDATARARVAVTRSTLWVPQATWPEVEADAVPFALDALDALDNEFQAALFFDSAVASARRCGDDAQAACAGDCDIVSGEGSSCCAEAQDALLACEALVVDNNGVARLRRPGA